MVLPFSEKYEIHHASEELPAVISNNVFWFLKIYELWATLKM